MRNEVDKCLNRRKNNSTYKSITKGSKIKIPVLHQIQWKLNVKQEFI